MDEEYDAVILGTGLKECVLSGLLSVSGKKVLHMDRNSYYGGACASMYLEQLFAHYNKLDQYKAAGEGAFGKSRGWNVDLIPKFLMADGKLVKLLVHTGVTRYLEFKKVDGSFVYTMEQGGLFSSGGGKIYKVPGNQSEALKSSLMGFMEKKSFGSFVAKISKLQENEEAQWLSQLGLEKGALGAELLKNFSPKIQEFVGHAIALYIDDSYLKTDAIELVKRMRLYFNSVVKYQDSPYLYPLYGLGELPQSFARLSAIYGGTYMLNKPFEGVTMDADGKVTGVTSDGETAKAKIVVADPSYFPEKCRKNGQVIRVICLLKNPIPNTNNAQSAQIIIPQKQVGRKNDIYVLCVSSTHQISVPGWHVAIVSTKVETANPEAELAPVWEILPEVKEKLVDISDHMEPTDDGTADNIFVSSSFDATTHFETTCDDVLRIYSNITGKPFDFNSFDSQLEEFKNLAD